MKQLEPALGRDDRCTHLLSVLQKMWPITESHQFYLDQLSFVHSRFLYLEYGRRFAEAGSLLAPGDVFFLTAEELLEAAQEQGRGDLNSAVMERRKLLEEWKGFQPPRFLGKPPPESGEVRDSQMERVFGITRGPQMERRATEVIGLAGAPGQVKGTVRILESVQQGELLKPGDILVTRTTTPAWTSLFGLIGGLVTQSGGVLCHGAVVAREYGIPAVVGARRAIDTLKDGDLVLVDGTLGRVVLLNEQGAVHET
jgi:pyruvate,water dikinase